MPKKFKVFDEGLPEHNASGEPRSSRPLRERRTNGVERLDPSSTLGKQQRSTTQPHQPQAAGTPGAKSNARRNRDASQSKHSSLDQNEEALLNTPEWEPVTACSAEIDLSPSTYKEEDHGVRQPPNPTWCEPPKPGTMDPAKVSKTAWRVYEGKKDFTTTTSSLQLDEKDLKLLRKNHESKEGSRFLYQTWASKEMVKFALENPEVMQNLFGCDCVDGQHPNFAKYFGQPCRTLLKPTSGAMYYIKVPGPTSPSIRDCRSFWKWKKTGADEAHRAGQGEPRLHYEQFTCNPKNTPEHHPNFFVARVYSFHKSFCTCKACIRKSDEGKSDESQDSVHQYVHDIALVQILDGQRGQVKPRKSGKEANSPANPFASRVPSSSSRHLTDSPVNQQVTTPARSDDSGAGSRSASRGRNSSSPCDDAMALTGGIKKSSNSHSKNEYRIFVPQQGLRNKGNNKLVEVVRKSGGSSKASRPSDKSATSTPSSRAGGSATRSSSVGAMQPCHLNLGSPVPRQRSLDFRESPASRLDEDLLSMHLTGQSPAHGMKTPRRPPAHPNNANNRAAGPEDNFGPETRPQHNDSNFAEPEMNVEADQDQMPIVSEVETNLQSARAEDEPMPELEGMGDFSGLSTSASDGLFSQHNDNDAGFNQYPCLLEQTMYIDQDNDRRTSMGSHTLQLSPDPPHFNPPSLDEHPENQQLFGDDTLLHRNEAVGGLAVVENSIWTNNCTDVAMPPCNQEEDMDVIGP